MKDIYLYLDDIRNATILKVSKNIQLIICRSYDDAVSAVSDLNPSEVNLYIDLDHDLGEEKSGYDFCKWLLENGWKGHFHIHSANPVGEFNMRQLLNHYGWIEI